MAFFEFKIVRKQFFAMSDAERIAALDKIEKDAQEAAARGEDISNGGYSNPFPDWVRALIKKFGKAKYDGMNEVYKVITPAGDEEESEDEYAKFKAEYAAAAQESPERLKWYNDNHLHPSITFDDEAQAMRDLEAHLGDGRSSPNQKKER